MTEAVEQKQLKMCPHCNAIHEGEYEICEECRNKFPKIGDET